MKFFKHVKNNLFVYHVSFIILINVFFLLSVYYVLNDKHVCYADNIALVLLAIFILNTLFSSMHIYYKHINNKLLKTIRISEQRLKYAVDATRDGLWDWNLETNDIYYSPRWKEMLGYEDNEISNVYQSWQDLIHPDDIKKTKKYISINHQIEGILFEITHRLKHKDGHWIWALTRGQTIFDENDKATRMIGFYTDITEQKKVEYELLASKQQFESFMENIPGMVTIRDKHNHIMYVNSKGLQFFGKEAISGRGNDDGSTPKNNAQEINALIEQSKNNGYAEAIIERVNDENKVSIYRTMVFPITEGKDCQTGLMHFDITDKFYLKEKLADKEEIIIAQSRHAAMGEMIGMIAHQWRQPISVIAMGANNLLIDIDLNELNEESITEEAQSIIKQTDHLSKTIDDFRNFFRPDKEVEEVDLKEIMYEVKKIIGKSLEFKQIVLSIKNEKCFKVNTYSRELLQVFINILKNAEEALFENREKDRQINVTISNDKECVVIIICDNGGGIDEKITDKIFNPYFSTKDKKTGTGLGLYMSKTIIEKHLNGTIDIYNTENGVCFKIAIPIKWRA